MLKQISKYRIAIVLCLALALCSSEAFAWGGGRGGGRRGGYYYRGGRWYGHGWFGLDFAVTALTLGAIAESLPPRYSTVVIGGVPYYYYDNIYYRPCPDGYVVVPAPVMTQPVVYQQPVQPVMVTAPAPAGQPQPQAQAPQIVTINIPNSRGGYTAITLSKSGNGYVGPQGEYYSEHPTVEQLKTLYGK